MSFGIGPPHPVTYVSPADVLLMYLDPDPSSSYPWKWLRSRWNITFLSLAVILVAVCHEGFGETENETYNDNSLEEKTSERPNCDCLPYFICTKNDTVKNSELWCPKKGEVCCYNFLPVTEAPKTAKECGWSMNRTKQPDGNAGPTDAGYGEFPWMVAILKKSAGVVWSGSELIGGGSIIHPSVVLTVAHKVDSYNVTELKCRAGEHDTRSEMEPFPHQDRSILKVFKHNSYIRPALSSNIALVFLEIPFDFSNPAISTACIASSLPAESKVCYGMGWGKDVTNDQYPNKLKKIPLPISYRTRCERALRRTRYGPKLKLHSSMLCAGGVETEDTCTGDGGSPLVCQIGDSPRYAMVGMVAWGVDCGQSGTPAAYVDVTLFRGWMTVHTRSNGYSAENMLVNYN